MLYRIEIDAAKLAGPSFAILGTTGALDARLIQPLQLEAGRYSVQTHTSSDTSWQFEITPRGIVDYSPILDASHGGFLTGRNSPTLGIVGFTITINAQALSTPTLLIYGITEWQTSAVKQVQLLPGQYNFRNPSGIRPLIPFEIKADGTVGYDPSFDYDELANPKGFFTGLGTREIVLLGHTVTIDATALTAAGFLVYGITDEIPTTKVHRLQLLPAQYNFRNPAGIRPLIPFEVKLDGTVGYDPSYDYHAVDNPKGFFTGLGTHEIVLLGHAITIDAKALTTPTLHVYGILNNWATSQVQQMQLLPGQYNFRNPPAGRPLIPFEIRADGTVAYDPNFDADAHPKGYFKGLGTSKIELLGHSIAVDASALSTSIPKFYINGITGALPTTEPQRLQLLPALYAFSTPAGTGPDISFEVTPDGVVTYDPERDISARPSGFLSGRFTDSFRVIGFSVQIDARAYAGIELVMQPFGMALDTNSPHYISLLPAQNLRIELSSTEPKVTYFDVSGVGKVILDDPYPFVDLRWQMGKQILRLTTDGVRQKGHCCLALAVESG